MAELAGMMVGNYFLLERLAHEGMVEMYRARPTMHGGYDVVLRLFRPAFPDSGAFREQFASEVEKVWRCHHLHILPLVEFGTGDDLLYCVTSLPETESLEQLLERQEGEPLPVEFVLKLIMQLCAAVQCAHEHEIVHGNIQPSSIFLDRQSDVLLTNFGMRRAYQDGEPLVALLDEGNPFYLAPEQSLGMVRATSDIYAIGVLLYQLLTGTPPYTGDAADEIVMQHTNEPLPSLRALRPDVPEALELVVRVALAKNPEARFPTAQALVEALAKALNPERAETIFAEPQRHLHVRTRRRTPTRTGIFSMFIVLLLLVGLFGTSFFFLSLPRFAVDIRGAPTATETPGGVVVGLPQGSLTALPSVTLSPIVGQTPPTLSNGTPIMTVPIGPFQTPSPGVTIGPYPTIPPTMTPIVDPVAPPVPVLCTSGSVSMDGSPSLLPLLQQEASDYQRICPTVALSLSGGGSRIAFRMLQQGQVDVASADVTAVPGWGMTDNPIAALLYAVITSPDIQVNSLSSSALQEIYRGRITNWAQLGGPDEPIQVVLRPQGDPVTAVFKAFVLNGQGERVKGIRVKKDALGTLAQLVSQGSGALSYVPLAQIQGASVHVMAIDGTLPSVDTLMQGTYNFWSVEHFYTLGNANAQVQQFIQFLGAAREAGVSTQIGVVPLNMLQQAVLASHLPGPEI
jgi:ABC-type phosphate transport system substrate-binding protein